MTEKNKQKIHLSKKEWAKHIAIILGLFVFLYIIFVYVGMPIYTRHSQSITVPNITNLSLRAAEKVLRANGLEPVKGEFRFDDIAPSGFVVFQNPTFGRHVKKGRRIYLTASLGSTRVKMPDLVGKSERDVHFMLERNKLLLGTIDYEFDRYFPQGVVMDQTINVDMEVKVGTPVDLIVSLGEEPQEHFVPNLLGRTLDASKLSLKKACLTLGKVQTQASSKFDGGTVIWQSREAGLRVAKNDTIDIVITKLPATDGGNFQW